MPVQHIQGDLSKMRSDGPIYFQEMALAHQFCQGKGIEIGAAAHNPFRLPDCINVAPWSDDPNHFDYKDFEFYRDAQVHLCGHYAKVDLVGEADAIPLPDRSLNYVLSSHVVEHLPDLISAFLEWNRLLKPGGVVLMIFPKRDALASDSSRPITPLEQFIEDYHLKRTIHTHPDRDAHGLRGHYYVFTLGSMLELVYWCNQNLSLQWTIEVVEESDSKAGNGHTVVCRYRPETRMQRAETLTHAPGPSLASYNGSLPSVTRLQQLLERSRKVLASEGMGAFVTRVMRWLGGERGRYK